jgi:hypothetical protein
MPQWLGTVLPGHGPWVHRQTVRHGDEPLHEWKTAGPDMKCKVVCTSCNSGWMSQLEEEAKPILTPPIQGHACRLTTHHLEILTYWALKTALMLDRCSEAERQNIPASEFAALYARRAPGTAVHAWIGTCDVARGSWFQARTVDLDSGDAQTRGFGATLWLGHLVFQLISIAVPPAVKLGLKPDLLEAVAPIWPRGFKLDWPVTAALSLEQVVGLGDRIAASGVRMYPY